MITFNPATFGNNFLFKMVMWFPEVRMFDFKITPGSTQLNYWGLLQGKNSEVSLQSNKIMKVVQNQGQKYLGAAQ